jgi:ribose transport system substrate-binding protein
MAMGAYQAVRAAGKEAEIKVFGFDGARDAVSGVAEGKIEATVMQFPVLMARTSADLANQYIQGERDFRSKTPVEVILITPENVDQYLQQ